MNASNSVRALLLLLMVLLVQAAAQGGDLLNAYRTSLQQLTAPNRFYFLEFPQEDVSVSNPTMCGDGSPFGFVFRRGSDRHLTKLLVEFEGGPAYWTANDPEQNAAICSDIVSRITNPRQVPWNDYVQNLQGSAVDSGLVPPLNTCRGVASGFVREGAEALFGTQNQDVPVGIRNQTVGALCASDPTVSTPWWSSLGHDMKDWSYILIPHCTLDWHLGRQDAPVDFDCGSDPRFIFHRGGVNMDSVLEWVNLQFAPYGGLEALVTTSGGKVNGCSNPRIAASIAPAFFAEKAAMQDTPSSSSFNKLVLVEGTSLWSDNLPSGQQIESQWMAEDLVIANGASPASLLNTIDDLIPNTNASYAWISGEGSNSESSLLAANFLANLQRKRAEGLYVFTPTKQGFADVPSAVRFENCPTFAFPLGLCAEQQELANFLGSVASEMSWSFATDVETERKILASDDDPYRLSFLSIVFIMFLALIFVWAIFFCTRSYSRRHGWERPPLSPNELWLDALTHYPRLFLFVSLSIPLLLSFLAVKNSGKVNLDFDSYLTIDTETENVAKSYADAQRYQRSMIRVENSNCQVIHSGGDDRVRALNDITSMVDDSAPFSLTIEAEDVNVESFPEHGRQRQLQYELYRSSGQRVSILYQNRNGGSVFEPEVLRSIKQFEEDILNFPMFSFYCFSIRGRCRPFDSIVPQFFPEGDLVPDIEGVLRTFLGDPYALWKVDQYFGPNNLASNITRTFIWLRNVGGDQSAANGILEDLYRDLFWASDQAKNRPYPDLTFTWENPHMTDLEANDAMIHDAKWAGGSFIFVGMMIFLKVRNTFVFINSMLGLALAFTTAYYWYTIHCGIPEITLLHVSSLFVMMGIGADDIFLMVDSFDHTKLAVESDSREEEDASESRNVNCDSGLLDGTSASQESTELTPQIDSTTHQDILRYRMKAAYATAGSMMLISSLTTAICFFSNAFAVVVVIRDFGIYMGMVVLVNFIHVMTILPSAIMVNELYLLPFQRRVWDWLVGMFSSKSTGTAANEDQEPVEASSNAGDFTQEAQSSRSNDIPNSARNSCLTAMNQMDICGEKVGASTQRDQGASTLSKMKPLDRWLASRYAPFVVKRRIAIALALAFISTILGIWGVLSFALSDGKIVLFKEQYNLGRLTALNDEYFNADLTQTIEGGGIPDLGGDSGGTVGSNPTQASPPSSPVSFPTIAPQSNPTQSLGTTATTSPVTSPPGSQITSPTTTPASPSFGSPSSFPVFVSTPGGVDPGTGGSPISGPTTPTSKPTEEPECSLFCHNGGTCALVSPTNPVCICNWGGGWGGLDCSVPICPKVGQSLCAGNGSCISHPNGISVSTICECNEGFTGRDCNTSKDVVEEALARIESLEIELIWGAEPSERESRFWLIRDKTEDESGWQETDWEDAPVRSTFDLSEPKVQEWVYEVVMRARNMTSLNVNAGDRTWIEIFKQYAETAEIGFPVPQDQFAGYLDLLREESSSFAWLIRNAIGTVSPGLAGDFLFASVTLLADVNNNPGAPVEDGVPENESLSERTYRVWSKFAEEINAEAAANGLPTVVPQSRIFVDARRAEETISSTGTSWLIANGLCLLIILLFIQNLMLTMMVTVSSILIFLSLMGLLFGVFSLPFGPVEALGVSIFIGLAANYSLHVVHAYHHSDRTYDEGLKEEEVRSGKVHDAIFTTGNPITASALSTIGGCLFLFACRTYVFFELGLLICSITLFALIFSMSFLPSCLAIMGALPQRNQREDTRGDSIPERLQKRNLSHQWDVGVLCGFLLRRGRCQSSSDSSSRSSRRSSHSEADSKELRTSNSSGMLVEI